MNVAGGVHRLKILWVVLRFAPAIGIVAVLAFSNYRPELMVQFSLLALLIAASLSLPFLLDVSFKTRLSMLIIGTGVGTTIFANLDRGQDAIYGDAKPALFTLLGVSIWVAWAAIEWMVKGFMTKP